MTPIEARTLSKKANLEQAVKRQERERLEREANRISEQKEIKNSIDLINFRLEKAAMVGHYYLDYDVSSMLVAEKIADHFRILGFRARSFHDTVGTGVDQWDDRYIVRVTWDE